MKKGTKVKCLVVIQSDDRSLGVDDGSPIVPAGTEGEVLGNSSDFTDGESLKVKDSLVVRFNLNGQNINYDVGPEELEAI